MNSLDFRLPRIAVCDKKEAIIYEITKWLWKCNQNVREKTKSLGCKKNRRIYTWSGKRDKETELYYHRICFEICICNKDYSTYVDVAKYKDRNPNKLNRNKFSKEEVERVWTMQEDPYYQIVLMLLYNGCRISEFLDLKKENVHLEDCRTFRSNDSYRTCLHASWCSDLDRCRKQNCGG